MLHAYSDVVLEVRRWENQSLHDLFIVNWYWFAFDLPMTGIAFSLHLKQSPEEVIIDSFTIGRLLLVKGLS